MKKIITLLLIMLCIATIISCSEDEPTPQDRDVVVSNSAIKDVLLDNEIEVQIEEIQANTLSKILTMTEDVYLENLDSSSNLIEIPEQQLNEVSDIISRWEIKKIENDAIAIYTFAIFIPERNIKIYIGQGQFFIEEGFSSETYGVDQASIEDVVEILAKVYISSIDDYIRSIDLTKFVIEAKDENKIWSMTNEEADFLMEYLKLIEIVPNIEMIDVPVEYPDYRVYLESESKTAILEIVNDEIIQVNIFNEKTYFKYQNEFKSWISVFNEYDSTSELTIFTKLITADSVYIESIGERKDIEGSNFYSIELARVLNNAKKEEVEEEIIKEETIIYKMEFEILGEKLRVDIYDNYIYLDNKVYHSESISEKIYTVLLTI